MSATSPDRDPLDLETILGQIARARQETEKFVAEQHKLMAEAAKLRAEERKLGRDHLLAPWLAIVGLIGGIITIASTIARWKGWAS